MRSNITSMVGILIILTTVVITHIHESDARQMERNRIIAEIQQEITAEEKEIEKIDPADKDSIIAAYGSLVGLYSRMSNYASGQIERERILDRSQALAVKKLELLKGR